MKTLKYYIDNTNIDCLFDKDIIAVERVKYKEETGKDSFLEDLRSKEILEWLSKNPDVTKWVAIDDMRLSGLDGHFVKTHRRYTFEDTEKTIRILTDCF